MRLLLFMRGGSNAARSSSPPQHPGARADSAQSRSANSVPGTHTQRRCASKRGLAALRRDLERQGIHPYVVWS